MRKKIVRIFTDGSCITEYKVGGYCSLIIEEEQKIVLKGSEKNTTNNRMELLAVIKALEYLDSKENFDSVELYSDSNYVVTGINEWLNKWIKSNWKTSNGSDVSNQDLWKKLHKLILKRNVIPIWIKSHNGFVENEYCDRIAREEARSLLKK